MLRKDVWNAATWTWQQIAGLRRSFAGNCVIGFVRVALSLTFVWLCKHIIDIATGKADGDIYLWIAAMVGTIVMQLVSSLYFTRFSERNRVMISNQIKRNLFGRVIRSSWQGKDALHTGDVVNRLESDVTAVTDTINKHIPAILISCFQIVCASVFLFTMQGNLLWVLLIIMPVALVVSKVYYKVQRRLAADIKTRESAIQSHIQESVIKRVLILCFTKADSCIQSLQQMQNSLLDTNIDKVRYSSRSRFFVSMGFMGGYIATFCWGAFGILGGTVTYGMMTALLQLVNQVQNPIVNMSQYLPQLITALASVDRLRELSQLEQEEDDSPVYLSGNIGIRIQNLCFRYPNSECSVISDFSYDFRPGKPAAIVGSTGSGKSTLMRLMLGALRPDSGKILLYNDTETVEMSPRYRCNFQYVPQGNSLMSGTVRDNLRLGNPDATEDDMREALRLAAADFVFQRSEGLDTECSEQGNGLSEGQAQRIAIARALLQKGSILLMDEACSALDSETESRILDNLKTVSSGKTIIWITHHGKVRDYLGECVDINL